MPWQSSWPLPVSDRPAGRLRIPRNNACLSALSPAVHSQFNWDYHEKTIHNESTSAISLLYLLVALHILTDAVCLFYVIYSPSFCPPKIHTPVDTDKGSFLISFNNSTTFGFSPLDSIFFASLPACLEKIILYILFPANIFQRQRLPRVFIHRLPY